LRYILLSAASDAWGSESDDGNDEWAPMPRGRYQTSADRPPSRSRTGPPNTAFGENSPFNNDYQTMPDLMA